LNIAQKWNHEIMKYHLSRLIAVIACLTPLLANGLSLQDAIEATLSTNPEILAAQNEFESRRYEVKQARATYLPKLSVSAGIGEESRQAPATNDERVDLSRKELGLSASQMLFDGFAGSSEIGRQKARLSSAEYAIKSVAERLALRTTEVYLNVLRHNALLDLARATLWEHQNIFDQMEVRHKTGVGSKADLDQISARLALANANMAVAQNNLLDSQTSFHRVTGYYPDVELMSRPVINVSLPASRELAIAEAQTLHPTLLSASADVKAAKKQYKAAGSRYWPEIRIEIDKRWDENVSAIEGKDEDLVVALRMNYTLFNGGANKARRKQTAYLMEESKDVRNNTRRQVDESLNLSWNAFDALQNQMRFLKQHYKAAASTKAAYAKQFNIGRRTLLDLLNTENEVVESKRSLINAEIDTLYAQYRIFAAMGKIASAI
jgi:adhesin transport system outer membrane protein